MRPIAALAVVSLVAGAAAAGDLDAPNAVLINVSADDLNRIVLDAFHDRGGPRVEGSRENVSSGVSDLNYHAEFSEPVLRLGADGRASIDLDILEADVRIGRVERRFLGRTATCENTGVRVDPSRPVDVTLDLRFAIEGRDLRILPEELRLEHTDGVLLSKPTRCRKTFLPKWLVWRLGKSRIRRQIDRLDDALLLRARESAAELNERDVLRHEWSDLELAPDRLDTSMGSLFVSLSGGEAGGAVPREALPDWVPSLASGSFLGVSEPFLNAVLRRAAARLPGELREPRGGLRKLFRSSSIYTLIPGLRDVQSKSDLRYGFSVHEPPRIEIVDLGGTAGADGAAPGLEGARRAMIRLELTGIEIALWQSDERRLGGITIDSATLGVVPYLNPLGGISFETVENAWSVSSDGIELDEPILAAVLQELFFGKIFETGYDPVARGSLDVGGTSFDPRYFTRVGQHLVVGLAQGR
jgi:hypothetical protein